MTQARSRSQVTRMVSKGDEAGTVFLGYNN